MKNDLYCQARCDFKKLQAMIMCFAGTTKELCEHLHGFNFEQKEKWFDCNFGCLTVTIKATENGLVIAPSIDIWDDKNGRIVAENITYFDLL